MDRNANRISVLDPVDVVTGEVYQYRTDFQLPGSIPLSCRTYYSSQTDYEGPLGHRWTHSYDSRLYVRQGTIGYLRGDGSEVQFPEVPEPGRSVRSLDNRYLLERQTAETFSVLAPVGLRYDFQAEPASDCARVVVIQDRNLRRVQLRRNEQGQLIAMEDTAGRFLQFDLDGLGHTQRVLCYRKQNPRDQKTLVTYQYDAAGDLVGVWDPSGNVQRYEYDEQHQMIRKTDRNGYSFHYRYNERRCVQTWGDDGLYSGQFTYDLPGRSTIVTGFDGRRTTYHYNAKYLVVRQVDSYGHTTTSDYDAAGNLILRIDRCGRALVRKYDDHGNITEEIQPNGQKITSSYTAHSQLLEQTDALGETRTYTYDDRGNLTAETDSGGTTFHRYDSRGGRINTKRPGVLPETYGYDEFGQLIRARDATGHDVASYEYDLCGNITSATYRTGRFQYTYDSLSLLIGVRYPDSSTETSTFDPEGNPTSFTDRLGRTWRYVYKARKQLAEVTAPDGGVTRFDYTLADEKRSVTDPNGNITEYVYNLCDQIVEVHRNGKLCARYERDPEGRLLSKSDAEGRIALSLKYGSGDQPEIREVSLEGQPLRSKLTYDRRGRLIAISDERGDVSRAYHTSGRMSSEQCNGQGVRNEFDEDGRLTRTVFGDGIEFRLRHHGDTAAVRDPDGNWHAFRFSGARLLEAQLASGVREIHSYDEQGRVSGLSIATDENLLFTASYEYDPIGRLVGWKSQGIHRLLEYDSCDRLTGVRSARETASETFQYDAAGNMQPPDEWAHLGRGNRLSAWGARRFEYDDDGRLSVETNGTRSRRYRYDSIGQLVAVESDSERVAAYEYDGIRRRTAKTTRRGRVQFGWEGTRLSWELHSDGVRRDYLYLDAPDHHPAMFCDTAPEPDGTRSRRVYFVHCDATRRPMLITNAKAEVVWAADWSAYGSAIFHSTSLEYNLRAPGQYYDFETGLHYNYHRYYDPESGRYLQPDPIGLAGGLNLYAYAKGNPLLTCDVLGLAPN